MTSTGSVRPEPDRGEPGDDDRTRSIIDAIFGASADQVRTEGAL